MPDRLLYPRPVKSPESVAAAWLAAESALPAGWWISLLNEYGTETFWMARAEVDQADLANEYLEAVAATAEGALDELRLQIATADLNASHVGDVSTPSRATSEAAMAEAWRVAEAALPKGWWIASILGFAGPLNEAGWFASANGGPTSGYRGRQGMGATPDEALLALGSAGPV